MMRKIILIFACLFIITLFGCDKVDSSKVTSSDITATNNSAASSNDPSLNSLGIDLLNSEEKYLISKSDDDLKELCSQLSILPQYEKQYQDMVLKYFPIFFEKFSKEQIKDISWFGFDHFYAIYVFTYKAEEKGGLETIYNEYKEKADNKYYYASTVYDYVIGLDNLSDDEYSFLYDEAYSLYAEAREDTKSCKTESESNEAFKNTLQAFGCIDEICKAMGKEIDPDTLKDFQKYGNDYIDLQ